MFVNCRKCFFLIWCCINLSKKPVFAIYDTKVTVLLTDLWDDLKLCPRLQAYAPGPYGDYIAPPPHASQIVYSADGQPYAVAYPYQYQGNQWTHYIWPEAFRLQPRDKNSKVLKGSLLSSTTFFFFCCGCFQVGTLPPVWTMSLFRTANVKMVEM